MPRHRKIVVAMPDWVQTETNLCLQSTATDAYFAKALAEDAGATQKASCKQIVSAAEKSLRIMENRKAGIGRRCTEGDRAARKFWEAKVCARAKKS
jgi:trans-aconitate methyltransferase